MDKFRPYELVRSGLLVVWVMIYSFIHHVIHSILYGRLHQCFWMLADKPIRYMFQNTFLVCGHPNKKIIGNNYIDNYFISCSHDYLSWISFFFYQKKKNLISFLSFIAILGSIQASHDKNHTKKTQKLTQKWLQKLSPWLFSRNLSSHHTAHSPSFR